MFLQQLPDAFRWPLLFAVGAALGALINLAIYRLALYEKRNISPWSAPPSPDRPRTLLDRIPIIGWFSLKRESDVYGKRHWIRPLILEVATGLLLAWFYHWNMNGGLYGGEGVRLVKEQAELAGQWNFSWFLFYSVLFALMIAATFIDFDEQTIPDWITIPGTIFALVCHSISPALRLPVKSIALLNTKLLPLDYWSPEKATEWHFGSWGIAAALAIVIIWCIALTPKWSTLRWGLFRGVKLMFVSILRPPRKTVSKVERVKPRKMFLETKILFCIAVLLSIFVAAIYSNGGIRWTALMDSLLGLAMGGGIVWAVRIIAGKALGVEAMGFGDVTLMCMVGAFIGWQGALLAFVFAPFTSIIVALVQLLTTGENRLAFGPYLCLGATIVVIGWNSVWNEWAATGVFSLGHKFLLGMIAVCLVMMAAMLGVWGKFKYRNE